MFRPAAIDNRAFTLLELIVVMVLLGITVSVAVPNLRTALYDDELKKSARKLVGLVEQVSQRALREQKGHRLSYNGRAVTVQIDQGLNQSDGGGDDETGQALHDMSALSLTLPESVRITSIEGYYGGRRSEGEMSILFSKQGYVDFTLMKLEDDDGEALTIMIPPFLNGSRIIEGNIDIDDNTLPISRSGP